VAEVPAAVAAFVAGVMTSRPDDTDEQIAARCSPMLRLRWSAAELCGAAEQWAAAALPPDLLREFRERPGGRRRG
jgi:hypothetical protein